MNGFAPSLDAPALLTANLALLEVGKLPKVVHGVEVADLHEPGTYALHDFATGLEASPPVGLPLEEVARMECIRPELKDTAELSGRSGRPEGEFLHERSVLILDQAAELLIKFGVFGVRGNQVPRLVVSLVSLVLPDVDCGRREQES